MNRTYQPEVLRNGPAERVREVKFGVAVVSPPNLSKYSPSILGYLQGPFDTERKALECVGGGVDEYVVRYNSDGTATILWHWVGDAWEYVEEDNAKED